METHVDRFEEPFAAIGDRVAFAKYGGLQMEGADGEEYRVLNDTDITAQVDEGLEFNEFELRKLVNDR